MPVFLRSADLHRAKRVALLTILALVGACGDGSSGPAANETRTLAVTITGAGTVVSVPSGISCTAGTCSSTFAAGASVSLTATPNSGGTFSGWSGACSGAAGCTVTMDAARSVTATFEAAPVAPVVSVVATDAIASETGLDAGAFTFTRSGGTASALALSISVGGTATNGTDYASLAATVTIPAGQSTSVVSVAPIADALVEGAETVLLTVLPNAAYTVGVPAGATVTIADAAAPVSPPQVTVVATDAAASEVGPDIGVFTISRSGPTTGALVVNVAYSGTAVNATDYASLSSPVTIPAGAASTTVTVTPTADLAVEGAETAVLTVIPPSGTEYVVGTPSNATVTIADAPVAGGNALSNGVTATGRIAIRAQTDSWTFSATQGDRLIVSMGESGVFSSDFAPWIRLVGPNGAEVAGYNDASAAQIEVTAPSTGTYTLRVASNDNGTDGTGDYRLTLVRVPAAFTTTAGDQGGSIVNGATHTGNIYLGDVDAWTVSAGAGEHVIVGLAETGTFNAAFTPWIRVYGPTGVFIGSYNDAAAAQVEFEAPLAGAYTVVVGTNNLNGVGDYRLTTIATAAAVTTSPGDEGGALLNGASTTGSIVLGDVDAYTMPAIAGENVIIGLTEIGVFDASFAPWIRVYSPTGVFIGQYNDIAVAQVEFTAPTTGTYSVVIGTYNLNSTGGYRLTAVRGRGPFTTSVGDEGGALANGAVHTGTIIAGDVDPWTLTAAAGENVIVGLAESGTFNATFKPWIRVYGPTGVFLGQYNDVAVAQVEFTAPTAGTYTVVVGTYDLSGVGDYRVTSVRGTGPFSTAFGDEGSAVVNGATHTGTILLGDVDPWTISAQPGEQVIVSLAETGVFNTLFAPWIRVYGPTGVFLGQYNDASASQVEFTASTAGIYTVVVGTYNLNGTGDYRLTVVKGDGPFTTSAGDEGAQLVNGVDHTGTIVLGDVDPWTLTAAAGERVMVRMAKTGTFNSLFTPWIRLYSPTGVFLGQFNDASVAQIDFTAGSAGTYTVVVGTYNLNGTGDYTVKITRP